MNPATKSVITKALAAIEPGADDASSDTGTFDVILSAPTLDRDGDTLQADEWETPLPEHITFDVDHGMSVASTVGSGAPRIEADGTLRVSGSYSSIDRAQEVRTLVNEGHIRTVSVAFLTTKTAKAGGKAAVTRELLNGAFVAVPSNREAVVLASKGMKAGARNSSGDQAHLQTAHDELVAAGAMCDTDEGAAGSKAVRSGRQVGVKSIVGSVEALQDRVNDALCDAYAATGYSYWGWLRGVLPNAAGDGGQVVFDSSAVTDGWQSATYSQSYTDDGKIVTLLGSAVEVDIHEIVSPDADADREATTLTTDDSGAKSAADAAKSAGLSDDDEVALRGRALALRARTAGI